MRLATLLLLAFATTAAAQSEADYILPGTLTRDTTLAELKTRFGADNVVVQTLDGAEGETFEGLVLFPDDPRRRAELFPRDERVGDGISAIRVSGESSRWKIDNGVRLGMTLDELVALNGKPIVYSGFDWDYGGAIQQWNGGTLEPADGGLVFRGLTLTHGEAPDGAYPLGDAEFRSDDPAYPQQGRVVRVGELMVSFLDPSGVESE